MNLVDAANFVVENYKVVDKKITVSQAVKEMHKMKEAENLHSRSIKDLRFQISNPESQIKNCSLVSLKLGD